MQHFPDPEDIEEFGRSFLRLMVACAELDRRVADIQNEITGDQDFGENHVWPVVARPKKMRNLIRKHWKELAEKPKIRKVCAQLRRAIAPCDLRNVIAHGHWWRFNPDTQTLTVRRHKLWPDQRRLVMVTVARIERAAEIVRDVEVELYKLTGHVVRKDELAIIKLALRGG